MTKFEIRVFQGSRSGTRRSKNFTIESTLSLDNIAETIQRDIKSCDTSPNQKSEPVKAVPQIS